MVLLATLDFAAGGDPASMVAVKRYHHQYLPDAIQSEPGAFSETEIRGLEAMGHRLEPRNRPYGNMQVVLWDRPNNRVLAASDPRGIGSAIVR